MIPGLDGKCAGVGVGAIVREDNFLIVNPFPSQRNPVEILRINRH